MDKYSCTKELLIIDVGTQTNVKFSRVRLVMNGLLMLVAVALQLKQGYSEVLGVTKKSPEISIQRFMLTLLTGDTRTSSILSGRPKYFMLDTGNQEKTL